jgi:uncharacterized membrane protein
MIIMVLDHVRDFFHADSQLFSPEDLAHTNSAIFFTRWITHFCAPIFVFLAGTSIYLSMQKTMRQGGSLASVSRFLVTRGIWFLFLDLAIMPFAYTFSASHSLLIIQVLWAFGWSMLTMALLVHVPWRAVLAGSLAVVALHNLFDGVAPASFGSLGWLWNVLHIGPVLHQPMAGLQIAILYPLVPWVAVMALGYCFGRVMEFDAARRRRFQFRAGLAVVAGFALLRWTNLYGDLHSWSPQATPALTVISFFNLNKYPPSLLYLMMTLGPALLVVCLLERVRATAGNPLLIFGRVPLFYYLGHWYVVHGAAIVFAWFRYGNWTVVRGLPPAAIGPLAHYPASYGYSLGVTHLVWISVVVVMYLPCRWYAGVKYNSRSPWFSYL